MQGVGVVSLTKSTGSYFYRNEIAGAFGDLGTFAPLVISMIVISELDAVSIFVSFGIFYIISALVYRLPVPIQPMKAIAALVVAGGVSYSLILASSITIGIFFFLITALGIVEKVAIITPKHVIRGIQLGLGLKLIAVAAGLIQMPVVIPNINFPVWPLTVISVLAAVILFDNRRIPAISLVLAVGIIPPFLAQPNFSILTPTVNLPALNSHLDLADILAATLALVIPQIPLTLGNSILATESLSRSFFPENRTVTVRRLGLTIGLMNIISGFIGGIPVCHGAGGLAGHYRFGARTGFSPLFIGLLLLSGGILYGERLTALFDFIPLPILGVILLFAGFELIRTLRRIDFRARDELFVTILVGLIAVTTPYGFAVGLICGILLAYTLRKVRSRRQAVKL